MPDAAGLSRVRRNTLFKVLGESTRAFSVLLFILIARVLGGAEFGIFSVAMALATFFAGAADGGLNQLMIRDIARAAGKARERTELTLGIKIFMAPAFLLGLVTFLIAFRYPPAMIRLGFYCGLATMAKSLLDYSFALFSGHEMMQYESILKAVNQSCTLVLAGWILLYRHAGIDAVALSMAGVNIGTVALAYGLLLQKGLAPSKPLFSPSHGLALLKEAFPLTISILFSALFIRIDVIMLSLFGRSALEIGQFAAGTRIIEAAGTVPLLLTAALFPVMADHAKNRPILFGEMLDRWRLRLLGISLAVGAVFVLARGPIVHVIFGVSFDYAAHLMAILAFSLPAIFLNYWYLSNLVVLEEQRTVAIGTVTALTVNALANILVITRWGAAGASVSMVAGQMVMCAIAHTRLQHFRRRIQALRRAKIKEGLVRFYQSSDAYYHHLDGHIEDQLEHFRFGHTRLSDWIVEARSILEVGCGSGILLYRLKQQYVDKKMCGVDLSPIGVDLARRRAGEKDLDIEFRVADVETAMPYPAESFDLILCNEVLEHLTDPESAIRHMSRMLAPRGLLVLVFPNRCIRAPLGVMMEKLWDTARMLVDSQYLHLRFETPPFDKIGADADATYIAHPWEVQRMVKRAGLHFLYKSPVRGRLVAQK